MLALLRFAVLVPLTEEEQRKQQKVHAKAGARLANTGGDRFRILL
jgi:hypothetical protein